MSPEQARGQAVDKRTDIWAFGCVLFEMLTGRRAFDGETMSDTLVSILEREPDWAVLPAAARPRPFARCSSDACARMPGSGCTTSPTRSSRSTIARRITGEWGHLSSLLSRCAQSNARASRMAHRGPPRPGIHHHRRRDEALDSGQTGRADAVHDFRSREHRVPTTASVCGLAGGPIPRVRRGLPRRQQPVAPAKIKSHLYAVARDRRSHVSILVARRRVRRLLRCGPALESPDRRRRAGKNL